MASGMEMMMKAFGVNPAEIIEQVGQFGEMVKEVRDALVRIESKLDDVALRVTRLENASVKKAPTVING